MSSFFTQHPILRPTPLSKTSLEPEPPPTLESEPLPLAKSAAPRAAWLDAFRGFTMLCLISRGFGIPRFAKTGEMPFVVYQFEHTAWIGWTVWDFIQPFFMFIVGAAMPFAFAIRRGQGGTW